MLTIPVPLAVCCRHIFLSEYRLDRRYDVDADPTNERKFALLLW